MKSVFIPFLMMALFGLVAQAETGVTAFVNLSPAGKFEAKTSQVKGSAQLKGDSVTAQNVKVPLDSLKTGIDLRDKHMKEKYLEIAKFPEAELLEASGQGGQAKGRLKIHGIEKEVSGTYRLIDNKELEAKFPIKLSDFKIEGIRYLGVGVKDDVNVMVTLPVQVAATGKPAATKKGP